MKATSVIAVLLASSFACARATLDLSSLQDLISEYTGGSHGVPGDSYLTSLATTLAQGYQNAVKEVVSEISLIKADGYDVLFEQIEEKFCTDPTTVDPVKLPASFTGPSFSLTFSAGACIFNNTDWAASGYTDGSAEIDCVGPAIVFKQDPATLVSEYITGTAFADKECSLNKTFAEQQNEVLKVFDPQAIAMDISQVASTLQQELTDVLGEFGITIKPIGQAPVINLPALPLTPILTPVIDGIEGLGEKLLG